MNPHEFINHWQGLRVVVIGDLMLDCYIEGDATQLTDEAPVPVIRHRADHLTPGAAGNLAANLIALGADVRLVSVIGFDEAALQLRAALAASGVSDRFVIADDMISTPVKQRIIAGGQHLLLIEHGGDVKPSRAGRRELEQHLRRECSTSDLILVCDHDRGVVTDEIGDQLAQTHREIGTMLTIDSRRLVRFRDACPTAAVPTQAEAAIAVGCRHDEDPSELAARLQVLLGGGSIAITLGSMGVHVRASDGTAVHIPAPSAMVRCAVGAGDTFAATFSLALASGAPPVQSGRLAVAAAAVAVSKPWTSIVDKAELEAALGARQSGGGADFTVEQVLKRLANYRRDARKIVFTNGVFDILHPGHVEFLEAAKRLGDVLVVGVNSDASARSLKGVNRPVTPDRERARLVAALQTVDDVVIFHEATATQLLREIGPAVYVKGGDYAGRDLPEAASAREVGASIVILPRFGAHSTTALLARLGAVRRD